MRDNFFGQINEQLTKNQILLILTSNNFYPSLQPFIEREQVIDVGIAEQNLILMGSALTTLGYKTFALSLANFATLRSLEHLRNIPNRHKLGLKLILSGAGFGTAPDWGPTHFMTDDLGGLTSLNNLSIYSPSDRNEASAIANIVMKSNDFECVRLSIADSRSVHSGELEPETVHRLEIGAPLLVFNNDSNFPPSKDGNFELNRTPLTDADARATLPKSVNFKPIIVLSYGPIITEAIAAAKLAAPQYRVQVYSCPKLPLHTSAYQSVIQDAAHVITFEEHIKHGGLGTAIAELVATHQLNVPLTIMGIDDPFSLPVGNLNYLRKLSHLTADDLVKVISASNSHNTNFE
jgi:transketolase